MNNKKLTRSAIAWILVLLSVFSVYSCSENVGGEKKKESETISGEETPQLKNYGGSEFRILSFVDRYGGYYFYDGSDIDAREETGDNVNDAVYMRNRTIEERYNIKIERIESEDPVGLAQKTIAADTDEYDAMFPPLRRGMRELPQNGYLVDLKSIPYLDLSKPWYDQSANEQLSVGGKLYGVIGDFTVMDKNDTNMQLFNKKIVNDLNLESPYDLVNQGKWTADKMIELNKVATIDLDGDGKMGPSDQYGNGGADWDLYGTMVSMGFQIIKKDKDDLPEYVGLDETGVNVFLKLMSLFGDKTHYIRAGDYAGKYPGDSVWWDFMNVNFMENRILFYVGDMGGVKEFRGMDADFGIIPFPKYDENQAGYHSPVSEASMLTVPVTAPDLEKVSVIMDALYAESKNTLIPAYYEVQLKTKLSRDEESAAMLDYIFSARRYDFVLIYNWGGADGEIRNLMLTNNLNIVSKLEKIAPKIKADMEKAVESILSNNQ